MEATISVICYKSKKLKNGESPLMLRISKDGNRSYRSLGISVNADFWDFQRNAPKIKCPNRLLIEKIISDIMSKYQAKILEEKMVGRELSASLIMTETNSFKKIYVGEYLISIVEMLRKDGHVGNSYAYLNLHTTLKKFYGKPLNFYFDSIDVCFCENFEKWMRKRQFLDTTMYFYFKTLRATYNRAIKDKFARRNNNPFPEYNLSRFSTKTKKRALSKDDMRKIIKLDCSERKNITKLAHDIFTFSYYCGGISFVDVANLTPNNIVDGRLHYIRQKTNGEINLCLMKEAQKIISKYEIQCHQSGYLFPILNQKRHITPMQKFNRVRKVIVYINRELHTIAKELNLNGDVTTYVARHTFATVLRKSGVDIGIISQSLGHQDIQTTQIYLDSFDNAQVDKAMKNLL